MGGSAKTAGDKSTDQPAFNLMGLLQGSGSTGTQAGQGAFSEGVSSLQAPMQYFSKLLSGDPTATASAIQPAASQVMGQYDAAYKNITDNSARGGQRSGAIAENQNQKAGAVSSLISGVMPAAAAGLGQLGTSLAGLGTAETSVGQQGLMESLQSLMNMRAQDINYTGTQQQNNAGMGSAIGSLLSLLAA